MNPIHWDDQVWRVFYVISGCWNLIAAIGGIFKPASNLEKFYRVKTDDFITIFLNRSFWITVLIFGIGYLLVAINPILFFGIVVLGIIGKIILAACWFYLFIIGKGEKIIVFAASGDLLFTLIFVLSLFSDVMKN